LSFTPIHIPNGKNLTPLHHNQNTSQLSVDSNLHQLISQDINAQGNLERM
jgi:hypothetical protein